MHKAQAVNPNDLYPYKIIPPGSKHIIYVNSLCPVAYILPNIIPTHLLDTMYMDLQNLQISQINNTQDSRGTVQAVKLGHYLERGGRGSISQSAFHQTKQGHYFHMRHQAV